MPLQFKDYLLNLPTYRPPRAASNQAGPITRLGANENPLGPSPKAVEAMRAAIANVNRYPDPGSWPLRHTLGAHFDIPAEQILLTNGSDEMIYMLCLAFLREGDEAVMADGSFVSYGMRTLAMGGQPLRVPLRDYVHDLDAMADAITGRTRLVFLCNPNNPTGTTVDTEQVARFLRHVPEDVLIVADEAYIEFDERPDRPDLLAEVRNGRQNLIVLRTFAKIYGLAGLRLGYAFSSPEIIAYLDRARTVFNVNAIAQAAAPAALSDTEHVERVRAHAAASRARYMEELTALGLQPIPSATNFMAVKVGGDDAALAGALMERGVAVNPIGGWGLPGHIRISFGTDEENDRFFAALREVLRPALATA
jgi:histidinol-phosphate aminotransferase